MAIRGDLSSIKKLKARIRDLPRTVAHDVAQKAAPEMTGLTKAAFSSGRSVYGESRPAGADGQRLTLEKTGAVSSQLGFKATGTVVRCVLGPSYAKYLIGKYGILPNGARPAEWSRKLTELVRATKVV
jgi:hypothetical protein